MRRLGNQSAALLLQAVDNRLQYDGLSDAVIDCASEDRAEEGAPLQGWLAWKGAVQLQIRSLEGAQPPVPTSHTSIWAGYGPQMSGLPGFSHLKPSTREFSATPLDRERALSKRAMSKRVLCFDLPRLATRLGFDADPESWT